MITNIDLVNDNKKRFLNALSSSSGKRKYKRYAKSPIRYAGGKSLAVGYIIEQIPDYVDYLVSPFIGGGSVEIACANELGMNVVGYDTFGILTDYWRMQLNNPLELAEQILKYDNTKEVYKEVKSGLEMHWFIEELGSISGTSPLETELDVAAHYWFNHNLSYGPGFLGWMSSNYLDDDRFLRAVNKVRNFRCDKLDVFWFDFEDVIPDRKKTFLYCDPPYYLDGDSKMFKGIYPQRNFPIHHKDFEHETLKNLLDEHEGGFILSYNDCSQIREWYSDYKIIELDWQYTMGQGETRIGKNRIENNSNHVKKSHELLIIGDRR